VAQAEPPLKRRRTRWAQAEEQQAASEKAIVLFPDKVVLSNGMQAS
jgi:hypothetical protein